MSILPQGISLTYFAIVDAIALLAMIVKLKGDARELKNWQVNGRYFIISIFPSWHARGENHSCNLKWNFALWRLVNVFWVWCECIYMYVEKSRHYIVIVRCIIAKWEWNKRDDDVDKMPIDNNRVNGELWLTLKRYTHIHTNM